MGQKWGQHFLVKGRYVEKIIRLADVQEDEYILEIGPGRGILTEALLAKGAHVWAVEIDPQLVLYLQERFAHNDRLHIVAQDVMTLDFGKFLEELDQPVKIVANLPYSVASSLIFYLLPLRLQIVSMTLMMQKEVAERICASHLDKKQYGPLSIICELAFTRKIGFQVPPAAFNPPPKVDSAVIQLSALPKPVQAEFEAHFLDFLQQVFNQRRKTLLNNLLRLKLELSEGEWANLRTQFGLRRPESLTLQEYLDLHERLFALKY